jgi:hypothetical protein
MIRSDFGTLTVNGTFTISSSSPLINTTANLTVFEKEQIVHAVFYTPTTLLNYS